MGNNFQEKTVQDNPVLSDFLIKEEDIQDAKKINSGIIGGLSKDKL